VLLATGCAPTAMPAEEPVVDPIVTYARAFALSERALLEELADADARVALRFAPGGGLPHPTRFDPFQFDTRSLGLDLVESDLGRSALPPWMTFSPRGALTVQLLEQDLLYRMLDEERARLEAERELPRRAAALVRALADTWPKTALRRDAPLRTEDAEADGLVAWRLSQLRESITPYSLSAMDRDDLADAARSLEPRLEAFSGSHGQLDLLEEQLEVTLVAPFSLADWEEVAADVHTYLGVTLEPERVDATLQGVELALRQQAEVGLSLLSTEERYGTRRLAGKLLTDGPRTCRATLATGARALEPPPERARACALVHALATAPDELGELAALLALHDGCVLARWAVAMAGPVKDPAHARSLAGLAAVVAPEEEGRLLRLAATHPVEAIAMGLAADMLLRTGPGRAVSRARAWSAFGNAPFDVVEGALLFAGPPLPRSRQVQAAAR